MSTKRGRKRKEVVEESDVHLVDVQMQQHSKVLPSPLQNNAAPPANGRVTRRSSSILNRCASSTTPSRYPLRNLGRTANHCATGAWRVLLGAYDEPSPESLDLPALQRHTPESPHENEVPNSAVTSSRYSSPHAERDRSGKKGLPDGMFTSKFLSQTEKPRGFHPIIPQSQSREKLWENMLPVTEATVDVSEKIATIQIDKNIQLNRSTSLNMTEIALMCNDSSLDNEEVESTYNPALVTVQGYRVKQEVAPLLRDIFAKYGDIAKDSVLKSSESRSHFLQMLCCIYQNLEKTNFAEVTPVEVGIMLRDIGDLESMKLNVGWLHMKLTEIKEVKELLRGYPAYKEEKAKIERKEKELETCEAELASMQQKILLLKDELTTMKTKNEQSTWKFLKMKEKVKAFFEKSLVDGLL